MANASEKQLKKFCKARKDNDLALYLRTQGDNNIIHKEPINLCEVKINKNSYFFGGISEPFYDKMVAKYIGNHAKFEGDVAIL